MNLEDFLTCTREAGHSVDGVRSRVTPEGVVVPLRQQPLTPVVPYECCDACGNVSN